MTQYFGGSGGGALARAHARIAARQQSDAQEEHARAAAKKKQKKDDGFSLGDLVPNLGLSDTVEMIPGILGGIKDLATGRGGYGHAWGNFGKGIVSSLASTGRVALGGMTAGLSEAPVFGGKSLADLGSDNLGDFLASNDAEQKAGIYKPSGIDKYWEKGILPSVIEDAGNIALVGGAASKVAKLGEVGKLAEAARTAEAAGKAGASSSVLKAAAKAADKVGGLEAPLEGSTKAAQVAERAKTLGTLEKVAHPYKAMFNDALRPLARAAQTERLARAGRVAEEVAPEVAAAESRVPAAVGASPLEQAQAEALAHVETNPIRPQAANESLLNGNAEPTIPLFRGEPANVSDAATGLNFHPDEAYARNFAGEDGVVRRVDVPQSVADEARQAADHITQSGVEALTPGTHALPAEWADASYPHVAEGAAPDAPAAIPEEVGRAPRVGPHEDLHRALQTEPIPPWAQRVVARLPDRAVQGLDRAEGFIEGRQARSVIREKERFQEAARREMFHQPAVQGLITAAEDHLLGQHLPDGTEIGPDLANQMIGNETIQRLDGTALLEKALPEGRAREALQKIVGADGKAIPPELMTPELDHAIDAAVEQWRGVADERLAVLEGGRLGGKGLEAVGSDVPQMTKGQQRAWKSIQEDFAKANRLEPAIARQAVSMGKKVSTAEDRIATIDASMLALEDRKARSAEAVRALFGDTPPDDKTLRQVASQLHQIAGESPAKARQRGYRAALAASKFEDAQAQIRQGTVRRAKLAAGMADMKQVMLEHSLPAEIQKATIEGHAQRRLDRLAGQLDDPSLANTPAQWKPLYGAAKELHKAAETDPALAEALADVPKAFSDVMRFAAERGFDPTHVASIPDAKVRELVYEQVRLGDKGRLGMVEEAGTRKARVGAFAASRGADALAAGMFQATHEANTNALVNYLEDTWVKPIEGGHIPDGYVAWDPERQFILRGEKTGKGANKGFQLAKGQGAKPTQMVPVAVQKTLESYGRDYSHAALSAVGKFTNPWRALILTWSPRWYVNNFIGNVMMATTEGVKLGDWASAWKSYRQRGADAGLRQGAFTGAPRLGPAFADIPEVTNASIIGEIGGQPHIVSYPKGLEGVKMAERTGGKLEAYNQVAHHVARANEVVDELARAAVYHKALRTGSTAEQALARSFEAMVDYGNLSPFERQVVRAVVPFYSWQKGILRVVGKLGIDHPMAAGITLQMAQLNKDLNIEQYGADLPSAYKGLIDVPGLGTLNTRGFNPFQDSTQMLTPQGIASSMNPLVQLGVRNAFGAPEGGFVKHQRVNEFGTVVPDTSPAEDFADIGTGLPQYQLGTGLFGNGAYPGAPTGVQSAERFVGIPAYRPDQVRKIIARALKARQRTG